MRYKFPPLEILFAPPILHENLAKNKIAILNFFLNKKIIIKDIVDNKFSETDPAIQYLLETNIKAFKIKSKLEKKLQRLLDNYDEIEDELLSIGEVKILYFATEFMYNGRILNDEDEKKTFEELKIPPNSVVTILFDIHKGLMRYKTDKNPIILTLDNDDEDIQDEINQQNGRNLKISEKVSSKPQEHSQQDVVVPKDQPKTARELELLKKIAKILE